MPVKLTKSRNSRKTRKRIAISQRNFPKAYISTIDNSRRPTDSVSDATNMELVQDNVWRPRPPLVRYGTQPTLTVIGRGEYSYEGERGLLWMFDDGGTGKIYKQVDGGAFEEIGGDYDVDSWSMFCQSRNLVYMYNGVNKLSYLDLDDDSITTYTALSTPSAPTVTGSANLISGTKPYDYYYKVTANNAVGESIASASGTVNVNDVRDNWGTTGSKTVAVTWSAVTNATSYTVYVGNTSTTLNELITLNALAYTDDGSLFPNPFKTAPIGNSTDGPVFSWMHVDAKNSQVYGVATGNKLYYSGTLTAGAANFSPGSGGGNVPIDEGGATTLNYVVSFRNGKGDPVITCSNRGAAGKGKITHMQFSSRQGEDYYIEFPDIYEASGQSGTYAPRATIMNRDSLTYFTGQDVKDTGTSQNIVNILTTQSIAQVIEPDLEQINLQALQNAVGVEYKDRLYFSLPVNSSTNSEMWVLDKSRKNAWILRWTVPAKDLWLYEDNDGTTHFCTLVDNKVLEFSRAGSQTHHDDNVPFRSRLAFEYLVWDENGISLGKVRNMYFKLLQPKGGIESGATGLTRHGVQQSADNDTFTVTTSFTGIGQWDYSGDYMYGDDPGEVNSFGKSVHVMNLKPKGLINQLGWYIIGETMGTDYTLSSASTHGWYSEDLILKA